MDKTDARIYVMTGDGELGEGQIWEAVSQYLTDQAVVFDQRGANRPTIENLVWLGAALC